MFCHKCKEFTTKTLNGYLRGFLKQLWAGNESCIKMEAAAFVKGKKFCDVTIIRWILEGLIRFSELYFWYHVIRLE